MTSTLESFAVGYAFGLDGFQLDGCRALADGCGVLVAAPTGAGKTVVGEFAVYLALAEGRKCFYTTPIKALSNQKYLDLQARHGADSVGLLTGDNSINGEAPIVVMTTEVLRNMLYASSSTLLGLGYVVMDEVHYLADRSRGAVWEEVIIHLPASVKLVSLSATVSNAEEFADWLVTVRGDTRIVVEEHRPVPLWQHVLAGGRLYDLFRDEGSLEVNPALLRLAREDARLISQQPQYGGRRARPPSAVPFTTRPDVVRRLAADGLLPAITFVFSRAGCDGAVEACLRSGLRLTDDRERREIRTSVEQRCADLPESDLAVLGYHGWLEGLERGIAAHHAGMLPRFKEVVEELFTRGLVKAVFATETLALGINMPARSVVLERLSKWNGETHAEITPGEYTQLTGRAGRRGIDIEGHAVVLWEAGIDPQQVAGLASTRTYPLRSAFRPSYSMAVNLVGSVGTVRARELLESSFAQFQADRGVVGLARQVARNSAVIADQVDRMACHLGDFAEYARLRRLLGERESHLAKARSANKRAEAARSLEKLRPGDVLLVPAGRRAGLAVVLDAGIGEPQGPRPLVLTADRQVKRLSLLDFPIAVQALGRLKIPSHFNAKSPRARRDLASTLRTHQVAHPSVEREPAAGKGRQHAGPVTADAEITTLRAALRAHPCHGCPEREEHARWAERHDRLVRENATLQEKVAGRTGSIARVFDRVRAALHEIGYLDGDTVTDAGRRLARLTTDSDLLVAECLRRGVFDGLDAPGVAAVLSATLFESRGRDDAMAQPPPPAVREALARLAGIWADLHELEAKHRLEFLREPDVGFVWPLHTWASGASLEAVLVGADLTAGDFVRWCKQVLDLLGQLATLTDSPVRDSARAAMDAVRRGVVAYSTAG